MPWLPFRQLYISSSINYFKITKSDEWKLFSHFIFILSNIRDDYVQYGRSMCLEIIADVNKNERTKNGRYSFDWRNK